MLESAEFDTGSVAIIGTPIFHVGNFLGPNFDNSISVGIVSQVNISPALQGWFWKITDQADLTVLPGGSGGGIFRADSGEVIGLMVAGVSSGLAAFVPSRTILEFAESAGVDWAVRGEFCPSDKLLEVRAELEEASLPPTLEELLTLP
jgi:polysaccharide pyruvyl transferase WcaK-like protein